MEKSTMRLLKNYLVKRTATRRIRFSLDQRTHDSFRDLLAEIACEAKPELDSLPDMVSAASRSLALDMVQRRPFLLTLRENRFVLSEAEAFQVLIMLHCDSRIEHEYGRQMLFHELHQLLT